MQAITRPNPLKAFALVALTAASLSASVPPALASSVVSNNPVVVTSSAASLTADEQAAMTAAVNTIRVTGSAQMATPDGRTVTLTQEGGRLAASFTDGSAITSPSHIPASAHSVCYKASVVTAGIFVLGAAVIATAAVFGGITVAGIALSATQCGLIAGMMTSWGAVAAYVATFVC